MADNYLEKRYEEVFGSGAARKVMPSRPALDTLLHKNRSYRGYKQDYAVHRLQLEAMVGVNPLLPSARNEQALRFRLVTKDDPLPDDAGSAVTASQFIQQHIRLGGALPELHLPLPGTAPEAFIVVCSTLPEGKNVHIDLGISLQSMLLKAVEMGLNGIIIGSFDKEAIKQALKLPCDPIEILAVGKGAENIKLVEVAENDSLKYYREDGVHYVPKIRAADLII